MSGYFEQRRIVVTGGAGFLGHFVLEGLRQRGCRKHPGSDDRGV